MSKYNPLWLYVKEQSGKTLLLSFAEIEAICGFSLDHAFLRYKKELTAYGWQAEKISLKQKTVRFRKLEQKAGE